MKYPLFELLTSFSESLLKRVVSGSPDWLLFLLLSSVKATDGTEDRHVVDTDSLSVPQQAEGFTAEHRPAQFVPPLGHTRGRGTSVIW